MRTNKQHRHINFEDRCVFQSKKGTLRPDNVRKAVARVDELLAKGEAVTEQLNRLTDALRGADLPTLEKAQRQLDHLTRLGDNYSRKLEILLALPEVKATLVKQQEQAEQRARS